MTVLQLLPALDVGGVETGTVDLARYLVSQGHRAIVVSAGGRLVAELEGAGARHYALPVGRKSIMAVIAMITEVAEIIRREEVDIVHARSRVPGIIAFFAARMTGRAFITTAHGYYRKGLLARPMSWGRYVIVASHSMAKHMARDFGVPYERLRLIPRGVDLRRYTFGKRPRAASGTFTIGMVSRITPLKGHADFLRAVALVAREVPGIKAVIAGAAPKEKYREELDHLVRGLGLARSVEFVGARNDVPALMRSLDVVVSATTTPEAFGRVIIEAQACGVPVVATKVGGVVDIIEDGKTGLLCAPQDPSDMASKILRYVRDGVLRESVVAEARKRVEERYDAAVMFERTMAVYTESLQRVSILVIKMSAVGDVILSVPSLKSIRARYPLATIKVLVGSASREVLARCPYIDGTIVYDPAGRHRGYAGLLAIGRTLREGCFDIVIDLQNSRRSHLLAFLSMAILRYGYDNGKWSFLLNRRQRDDAPYLDPIDHQSRTLRLAGIKPVDKALELWPSPEDARRVDAFLADQWIKPSQPLVGIHLRASRAWYSKNWPPAYIAEFCDRVARELRVRVVLTGSADDAELADHVMRLTRARPANAVGKTSIPEFAALVKRCAAFVSPDSASLHVACAMGVPVVALFGPTDPKRHLAPSQRSVVIWKGGEFSCCPCYKPVCPRQDTCMKRIGVSEVVDEVKKMVIGSHESAERIDAL